MSLGHYDRLIANVPNSEQYPNLSISLGGRETHQLTKLTGDEDVKLPGFVAYEGVDIQ